MTWEANMRKQLFVSAAIAGLCVIAASMPAGATERKSDGLRNGAAVAIDMSARRYRHHVYRYHYGYRHYYGRPRYYYSRPYYPYGYGYNPGYYSYGYAPYPYYYRRPGIYFGFGF